MHGVSDRSTGKGGRGHNVRALLLLTLAWATAAAPAPYVPAADDTVLEQVAARSDLDRLEPLRRKVQANPRDLAATLQLAQSFLELGRTAGDPRFTAYAESTLLPWMAVTPIPEPVLVLQATALQNQHQFPAAMALLDRAMQLNPGDPQVWLTRATIFALRNDVGNARRACARLARTADALVALTCLTGIDGRNGHLGNSYDALRQVYADDDRLPAQLRVWTLTQLADMAERLGDDAAAQRYFQTALRVAPADSFSLAAYADLLIRVARYREAIDLLRGREAQDNLLLRLAIAGHQLQSAEGAHWAQLYADRVEAAHRDGDTVHIREQARFALEVQQDASHALALAARNWSQQREPADLRIYWRAARATNAAAHETALRQWLSATHYEDATLRWPG